MGRRHFRMRHTTGSQSSLESSHAMLPEPDDDPAGKPYIHTNTAHAWKQRDDETVASSSSTASSSSSGTAAVAPFHRGRSQSDGHLLTGRTVKASTTSSKRVSFASLEMRSYEVVPGDHVWCSGGGCSVSLGWTYLEHAPVALEDYERQRSPRRSLTEMRMDADERRDRLTQEGWTPTELRRASRQLYRARSCVARLGNRTNDKFFQG